jgi:hypothetical protein
MDRERAEAHLRLVAEAELHGITTRPQDGAPLPPAFQSEGTGLTAAASRRPPRLRCTTCPALRAR